MKLIPFYDDPSFDYKKYWQERQYENLADQMALKRLLKLVPGKASLIDIGAGFGRLAPVYHSQFKKCFLVDPSERMLNEAQNKFKKKKNLKFIKAYVEKLPFEKEVFDVALFIRIIHHLKSPPTALKEAARTLKPGGFLVLEYANKLHAKSVLKALLKLDLKYLTDQAPLEVGPKRKGCIPFLNFHPHYIKNLLKKNGFKITKTLSVSNLRNPLCKKILPLKILLFLEEIIQVLRPPFFKGPSIFILAQKRA